MIEAPPLVFPDYDLGEREMLLGFLDLYRATLLERASDLTSAQLAATLPPSPLTLGGLVKHMAYVEDHWFAEVLMGRELPEPWASADWDTDRDWELNSAAADRPEELADLFAAACSRSASIVAACPTLAQPAVRRSPDGGHHTLRWILVHMIEEYARHCGHADLIRESIDGRTAP